MSLRVYYEVLNQRGTPALFTDTFANRPAFGFQGRLFISTNTGQIFEDTGTAWTLVADAGVGGGTLSSVCVNGNTTATGIVITAGGLTANQIIKSGGTAAQILAADGSVITAGTNITISGGTVSSTSTGMAIGGSITSATAGSVLFAGTSGVLQQDNANFFWDDTNNRLGIGTALPGSSLDIHGSGSMVQLNGTSTNNSYLLFQNAGTGKWRIGNLYNAGANTFEIHDILNGINRLTILNTGATTLNGSLTLTGALSGTSATFSSSVTATTALLNGSAVSILADGIKINRDPSTTSSAIFNANGGATNIISNSGIPTSFNPITFRVSDNSTTYEVVRITGTSNVLIGTTTDAGFRLDVNGTARVQGVLTTSTVNLASAVLYLNQSIQPNCYLFNASNITILNGPAIRLGGGPVGINTTNGGVNATTSSILDCQSTTLGFLPPRMTTSQRNAIVSPATGLIVFDTDIVKNYVYNGTNWQGVIIPNSSNNTLVNSTVDNGQGALQVSGNIYVTGIGAAGSAYSVSSTLTTAYYHVFNGAAGQTLTLPSPASNNVQYVIINTTANTVDVAAATSTNIVTTAGTSVASITLIANQRVFIIANGGTNYFQIF
jgi:hypothetical protein